MIAAMLNIDELQRSILIIVIESGNLRRMELGDPATLESTNNGGVLTPPRWPLNFNVLIAYDTDEKKLHEMAKGDLADFLRYLERGRKYYKEIDGVENAELVNRAVSPHGFALDRLEDEAIDGVPLSPDDALRVFDCLHAVEAERNALLKEKEQR